MMHLKNSSLSSLGSNKDKKLPPIPLSQEAANEEQILKSKTLNRKNFKKLSLESTGAGGNSNLFPSIQRREVVTERDKAKLGFLEGHSKLDISQSNRNVDPELHSSTDVIMNQFSSMNLANIKEKGALGNHRSRQTVISSISPTKSSENSPQDSKSWTENVPVSTTSSKLDEKDLVMLKKLGSGNSGTVSKVLHVPSQKTMAKKVILIDLKSVIQTQIIRELRILHECRSPYIIEFFGAYINNYNTIVLCMEYCNCGSLDKILPLCDPPQFPLYALKKLSYSILSGLTYLHAKHKIIHRDIKPSNVLMNHVGDFKLCDFGVLRELTNSLAMADTFVGTSMYMSPERIQGLNYGVKSDVWSMGLMLIELAKGSPVWLEEGEEESPQGPEGILDLLQRIVNEPPPTLTNKINPYTKKPYDRQLCSFIEACLVKDDSLRKSPAELLEEPHAFLAGTNMGVYDKDVKTWAKKIRKIYKTKGENLH